jgi:hypothetical protein
VRLAGIAAFALQAVAVVATGNHYLTDAVVGLAVCGVAWVAALRLNDTGYPRLRAWLASRERRLSQMKTGDQAAG